ncbi:hypothetical protein N7448_002133 [Penicillium atrosanguineum]|uniref:Major facilitator superfamily (MFS) profile domain-containing protein n=1 Tax=Penicillium atrosanguineum TaxID=1132637 RepID=A0A9W9HD27_9EURO|nr:hypothetical protein N7526_006580 [Penicillium atrosanguineum]KAJ5144741.1 hypothetical protein N7448_002133 [Penicillium atrosanguineum]KAJ5311176.1 hypothetical protein N7476_007036 [Penicillium atrosanguineum]
MRAHIPEKIGISPKVSSADEPSIPGRTNVHYVDRSKNGILPEYEDRAIPGYDANLMRLRATLSSAEEQRLLRRIDWHLLPLLAVMYMLKSVDASNVSYARIMDQGTPYNILTELKMTSDQYNLVTTLYYVPYILAEAPSNLLLKGARPSVWQARIMVSQLKFISFEFSRLTDGLYIVRFFLGLFEAGLWPGMLVQLCYWYRPDEIAPRVVLVTVLGCFSTVISGVLAFAFNSVVAGGLSGWKWLISTEGLFTVLLGIFTYFFLPDFPSTASWLSDEQKDFIQARLPVNSPRSMGESLLLNIPSAVFAVVLTIAFGIFADTGRIPQPAIPLAFMIVIEACYGVLYIFPNNGGVYAATVIAGGFSTAWYTMMWPWRVQTTEGATGSAFAIAFANSYGQIGGAVGSQLFNSRYGPRYTTSFGIAMGFVGMAIVMNLITWGFTWKVDVDTRRLKRIRVAAAKQNQAVLDDVDIHIGEK